MDDISGIIYMYTSPSGKQYIGQTINEQLRINAHRRALGKNNYFHKAIRKYGFDNLKYEILHSGIKSKDVLNLLEYIEIMSRSTLAPYGYNSTTGGGSWIVSEETKKNMSIAKYNQSEETRHKLSVYRTGKKLSEECKAKKRKAMIELWKNLKYKEKIISKMVGRKKSKEHIEKVANWHRGRKRLKETCDKISKKMSRKVVCIETGIVFESIKKAGEYINKHPTGIGFVLHGKALTCGGYTWAWYKEEEDDK